MRRRAASLVAVAGLAAAIVGSTLGATTPRPAAAAPLLQIGRAHAGFVPSLTGTEPVFILFLGSDARAALDERVDRARSDSIHLIGLNPGKRSASILGIPRDAWVDIPGFGSGKINSALALGGPELVVRTVEGLTGIRIHYWALTSFEGLARMVNGIGGLVVDVPLSMHDSFSGSDFEPGVQRLSGEEALAFTRDRHSLPSGDFGRSENQGRVFLAALEQFRREFTKDPSRLFTWVAEGLRNIQTDLPLQEVLDLAFTAYAIRAERVENMVVPATLGTEGSLSVVVISSSAQAIYRDLEDDGLVRRSNVPPSPTA